MKNECIESDQQRRRKKTTCHAPWFFAPLDNITDIEENTDKTLNFLL